MEQSLRNSEGKLFLTSTSISSQTIKSKAEKETFSDTSCLTSTSHRLSLGSYQNKNVIKKEKCERKKERKRNVKYKTQEIHHRRETKGAYRVTVP